MVHVDRPTLVNTMAWPAWPPAPPEGPGSILNWPMTHSDWETAVGGGAVVVDGAAVGGTVTEVLGAVVVEVDEVVRGEAVDPPQAARLSVTRVSAEMTSRRRRILPSYYCIRPEVCSRW